MNIFSMMDDKQFSMPEAIAGLPVFSCQWMKMTKCQNVKRIA